MLAVWASFLAGDTGGPAEADRWADVVFRWQCQNPARTADPYTEGWTAILRAVMCRRGVEQMRADADEAVRLFAADRFFTTAAVLLQGIARLVCGDLEGGEASLEDALRLGEEFGVPEVISTASCERALLAMARGDWAKAEALAGQAGTALRQAGMEDHYSVALACAVQARVTWHKGDVAATRQLLVRAQRLRPLLTHVVPVPAVQALIQLTRVHLAMGDLAGARTLMRETDELLKRRSGLGTLVGEAQDVRARLAKQRGRSAPGASALTDAELRLLPLLTTHLTFPELGEELFISVNTVKTQANSIYRKLGVSTRSQAVTRARELGLLEG
jgi:LuxR family maltose regulon positive regulatory protein